MKQLQWTGLACFQKYLATFGLLCMMYQPLYSSPTVNPSQSSVELDSSVSATDRTPHDFSLKMIPCDGTEIKSSDRYFELLTLIRSYYQLQEDPESAELKLKSDFESYYASSEAFTPMKLIFINDVKLFCFELSKFMAISAQSLCFHPISSPSEDDQEMGTLPYKVLYILVYSWVYRDALLRCDFEIEKLKSEEIVDSIRKSVKEIFGFILMINPSSRSYLDKGCIKGRDLQFSGVFCHILNEVKTNIFKANPFIIEMGLEKQYDYKTWKWDNSENDKLVTRLRNDFLDVCDQLHVPFTNLIEVETMLPNEDGTQASGSNKSLYCTKLEKSFVTFQKSVASVKEKMIVDCSIKHVSILEFCESRITAFLSNYSQFETILTKYAKLLNELEVIMKNVYKESIKEVFRINDARMKSISWIRALTVFPSYCWETAHIIEYNSNVANSVADSILKMLEQEDSIYFDKLISKHNLYFPGIVKSICDRKQLSLEEKTKLPSVNEVISKIKHEKSGLRELMNLYYAVMENNLDIDVIHKLIKDLLRLLFDEGIEKYDDVVPSTKPQIIMMVYAVNILLFNVFDVALKSKNFSKMLCVSISFNFKLDEAIIDAISSSPNDSLSKPISELVKMLKDQEQDE